MNEERKESESKNNEQSRSKDHLRGDPVGNLLLELKAHLQIQRFVSGIGIHQPRTRAEGVPGKNYRYVPET